MVIYLSTTSSPPDTSVIQFGDKIFHTLGYFCLYFWFGQIYQTQHNWRPVVALIILGVTLEFVQNLSGYRTLEIADMLANTTGVLLGWVLATFVYHQLFEHIEAVLKK